MTIKIDKAEKKIIVNTRSPVTKKSPDKEKLKYKKMIPITEKIRTLVNAK